jgi:hypothetical protein
MKFVEGQVANPSGRKVGAKSLTKQARKSAHEALAVLTDAMVDQSATIDTRAMAAAAVLGIAAQGKPIICQSEPAA